MPWHTPSRVTLGVSIVSYVWIATGLAMYVTTVTILVLDLLPKWQVVDAHGWNNFDNSIDSLFFGICSLVLFGWFYAGAAKIWERNRVPYQLMFAKHKPTEFDPDPNTLLGSHPYYSKSGITSICSKRCPKDDRVHNAVDAAITTSYISIGVGLCVLGYWTYATIVGRDSGFFPSSLFPMFSYLFSAYFFIAYFVPPFTSTRYSLGVLLKEVAAAIVFPVYGVDFVHVVIADALTSASLTLWDMESSICFFFSGMFLKDADNVGQRCLHPSWHWAVMNPVMNALPFWMRFVQCLYRVGATRGIRYSWGHTHNYVNAAKYASALLVVLTSSLHDHIGVGGYGWTFWLWILALVVKTLYCYVWDVMMDWDLCYIGRYPPITDEIVENTKRQSGVHLVRNTGDGSSYPLLLRPERIYSWTAFYYVAIFTNFLMRCSWSIAISVGGLAAIGLPPAWHPLMALVEILRRAQWAVFRMENEALQVARKRRLVATQQSWDDEDGGRSLLSKETDAEKSADTSNGASRARSVQDPAHVILHEEDPSHVIPHENWDSPLFSSSRSDLSQYQLYGEEGPDVSPPVEPEEEIAYDVRFSDFSTDSRVGGVAHYADSGPILRARNRTHVGGVTHVGRRRSCSNISTADTTVDEEQPLLSSSLPHSTSTLPPTHHGTHSHFVHRFN